MRINIDGPNTLDFDASSSLHRWIEEAKGNRHLNSTRKCKQIDQGEIEMCQSLLENWKLISETLGSCIEFGTFLFDGASHKSIFSLFLEEGVVLLSFKLRWAQPPPPVTYILSLVYIITTGMPLAVVRLSYSSQNSSLGTGASRAPPPRSLLRMVTPVRWLSGKGHAC